MCKLFVALYNGYYSHLLLAGWNSIPFEKPSLLGDKSNEKNREDSREP
jgi:hypothetical protein